MVLPAQTRQFNSQNDYQDFGLGLRAAAYIAGSIPQPYVLFGLIGLEGDVVLFRVRFVIIVSKHFDDKFEKLYQESDCFP